MAKTSVSRKAGLLRVRVPVSQRQGLVSAIGIWVVFFGVWVLATRMGWVNAILVPPPEQVFQTIYTLFAEQGFASDVLISVLRVLGAFAMACVVAVPLGVAMGAFPAIDAVMAQSQRIHHQRQDEHHQSQDDPADVSDGFREIEIVHGL